MGAWGRLAAVHDTGFNDSVMTTAWRLYAQRELEHLGLRMVKTEDRNIRVRGLGGAMPESIATWRYPCGLHNCQRTRGSHAALVSRGILQHLVA